MDNSTKWNTDSNDVTGNIRFKIVDLPDSSGILNPGSGSINIFQRSTPGRGQFNNITNGTWYDYNNGEYVTPFTGTGEFADWYCLIPLMG